MQPSRSNPILRGMALWLALGGALSLAACDPDKGDGSGDDGGGDDGDDGGTTDSGDVGPGDLEMPEEVLGVPNMDDDNENGDIDWADAAAGDNEQVPVGLDPDALTILGEGSSLSVAFEGEVDLIRVWLGDSVVADEDTTSFELSGDDDLSTLAIEFARPMATGQLVFTHIDAEGAEGDSWTVALQAAPLILNHHLQPAEWAVAVDVGGGPYGNADFISGFRSELGSDFGTVSGSSVGYDVWIQDEIEFGTFTAPGYEMDFVIDSIRNNDGRYLDHYAEDNHLGPDFGSFTWGSGRATSQDSFGNLEVSPPVTVDGVEYPFGRIYYGDSPPYDIADDLQQMMAAQQVQAPFTLDISWLCVGHVDEYISMLPDPDAPKGFRVWVADVDEGQAFLESMDPDEYLPYYRSGHHYETAGDMLDDASLWSYNNDLMEEYIEPSIDIMKAELGLDESDFVRVPGLFERSRDCGGVALALIPATVNMQVNTHDDGVGADLFIPDPFLRGSSTAVRNDPFVQHFEALLPANLTAHWLDDWNTYHMAWGEVHCGSNTIRTPTADWWTEARHLMED